MKKNTFFEHTLQELDKYSKLIKESYVFDDETNSYNEEDMVDDYSEEDMNPQVSSNDKINQIRMLALDGIQEYADDVDSDEYDFFKKIWLMCDKVCSEKDSEKTNEI